MELDVYLRALLRMPQLRTSLPVKQFLSADFIAAIATSVAAAAADTPMLLSSFRAPAAPTSEEMLALPYVDHWVRFRAERRYVSRSLSEIELSERRARARVHDSERRRAARRSLPAPSDRPRNVWP